MLCDCELGVIQQYNIYSKTATFFEKSGGNTYLGLAVALATWYNNLWKLMIDKKINKSELCKSVKISSSTMAKMTNEEMVSLSILEKICAELECNISDVMEFTDLEVVKQKLHDDK